MLPVADAARPPQTGGQHSLPPHCGPHCCRQLLQPAALWAALPQPLGQRRLPPRSCLSHTARAALCSTQRTRHTSHVAPHVAHATRTHPPPRMLTQLHCIAALPPDAMSAGSAEAEAAASASEESGSRLPGITEAKTVRQSDRTRVCVTRLRRRRSHNVRMCLEPIAIAQHAAVIQSS